MKIKIGVMGSAEDRPDILEKGVALGRAIAARDAILLTGATTGVIHTVGKSAHEAGAMHIGISPGHDADEHAGRYALPLDACDAIICTGFGLKGRNVVLVRSCDIVIFIAGSTGSLNEFTVAYDEGKVIGALTGSGGVADEIERLMQVFSKQTKSQIVFDDDPVRLIDKCLAVRAADGRQ
jgi:uncharacterized protein (TIGR00725 family)